MTITIIHGEDNVLSRKILNEEKARYGNVEIISFDGAKIELTDLIQALESTSLIFSDKLIVVENLFLGGIKAQKEKLIDQLIGKKYSYPIILWENKEISKSTINKYFSKARVINCQFPKLLFRFLDSIGVSTSASLISDFHSLLQQKDPELIYVMVLRQLRNLIIVKDLGKNTITGLKTWQVYKFLRQAKYFSFNQLVSLYRQLLLIDYQIKSGNSPYSLVQQLDIFLLNL